MNTNNISKEFVFGLFLKFFPQVINNLTGHNIINLELEKKFYDRKIDAYTKTADRQIFIENQLTRSDNPSSTNRIYYRKCNRKGKYIYHLDCRKF